MWVQRRSDVTGAPRIIAGKPSRAASLLRSSPEHANASASAQGASATSSRDGREAAPHPGGQRREVDRPPTLQPVRQSASGFPGASRVRPERTPGVRVHGQVLIGHGQVQPHQRAVARRAAHPARQPALQSGSATSLSTTCSRTTSPTRRGHQKPKRSTVCRTLAREEEGEHPQPPETAHAGQHIKLRDPLQQTRPAQPTARPVGLGREIHRPIWHQHPGSRLVARRSPPA
jgi:hypothetical protein